MKFPPIDPELANERGARSIGEIAARITRNLGKRGTCVIQKPDRLAAKSAPRIDCAYCHTQGVAWCAKCFAPLCLRHIWPYLSPYPHRRIDFDPEEPCYCREHSPTPYVILARSADPEGYVD